MDLGAPVRDVDELVDAYAESENTDLAPMKDLWRARNFSFIHEARPVDVTPPFFAQALFSSALCHVGEGSSLSSRLGGLYVLYLLHETQPEPSFRIYLCLDDMDFFHKLLKEVKASHLYVAFAVMKKMFNDNMFLYGSMSASPKKINEVFTNSVSQAKRRLQRARDRLLANVPLQEHLYGQMKQAFCLEDVEQLVEDYAATKQLALSGQQIGALLQQSEDEASTRQSTSSGQIGAVLQPSAPSSDHDAVNDEVWKGDHGPTIGKELLKEVETWEQQRISFVGSAMGSSLQAADGETKDIRLDDFLLAGELEEFLEE